MRATVIFASTLVCVVLMTMWFGPRAPQTARFHPPSPTAEEEAGDVLGALESHPRAAPRGRAPVPQRAQAIRTPTVARQDLHLGVLDPAQGSMAARPDDQRVRGVPQRATSVQSPRVRTEERIAGAGDEPSREQAGVQSAGSSVGIPVFTPPSLRTPALPGYPSDAFHLVLDQDALTPRLRVEAAEGRVVLKVLVRADGSVARVEVATSSGIGILDDAAAHAAWRWLFAPATRDGQPVEAWALVPVLFVVR